MDSNDLDSNSDNLDSNDLDTNFLSEKLATHIRDHPMQWREEPSGTGGGDDFCKSLEIKITWKEGCAMVHTASEQHLMSHEESRKVDVAVKWARATRVAYIIDHGKEE